MSYYIIVERERIYVSKGDKKDKWDRIVVPSLHMQNVQNACAVKKCGGNNRMTIVNSIRPSKRFRDRNPVFPLFIKKNKAKRGFDRRSFGL